MGQEIGVPGVAGIFAVALARLRQHGDEGRHLAPMDQVVEDRLQVCMIQEILAVVDDEEGIAPILGKAGGEVDADRARLAEGAALDRARSMRPAVPRDRASVQSGVA